MAPTTPTTTPTANGGTAGVESGIEATISNINQAIEPHGFRLVSAAEAVLGDSMNYGRFFIQKIRDKGGPMLEQRFIDPVTFEANHNSWIAERVAA
jgi:hypothetical protein